MSIIPINLSNDVAKLLNDLPKSRLWEFRDIYQYQGFWLPSHLMDPIITFTSSFHARDDDVFLASSMKTGTTWLKALSLCIMQKSQQNHEDILTIENPHFLVPSVESIGTQSSKQPKIDIYDTSAPRLLHTHLPYALLPDSVKNSECKISECKIVYIARNPKDTLISLWHFLNSIARQNQEPYPIEKAVDCFCSGEHLFGPFFDHVAEYWKEGQKRPQKILFVKYEELKNDAKGQVKKIAEFLGRPFVDEKEVDEILWKCSLERLKNLEVNKSGSIFDVVPNRLFLRKGEIGDWRNYLTHKMEEQIDQISRIKFEPFGLFL